MEFDTLVIWLHLVLIPKDVVVQYQTEWCIPWLVAYSQMASLSLPLVGHIPPDQLAKWWISYMYHSGSA